MPPIVVRAMSNCFWIRSEYRKLLGTGSTISMPATESGYLRAKYPAYSPPYECETRIYGDLMRFLFKSWMSLELTYSAVIGFAEEMLRSGELWPRPLLSYMNRLPSCLMHSKNVLFADHASNVDPVPLWKTMVPLNLELGFGWYWKCKRLPSISVKLAWAEAWKVQR